MFQRLPFKKLHDNEVLVFILVHVINRADMGWLSDDAALLRVETVRSPRVRWKVVREKL